MESLGGSERPFLLGLLGVEARERAEENVAKKTSRQKNDYKNQIRTARSSMCAPRICRITPGGGGYQGQVTWCDFFNCRHLLVHCQRLGPNGELSPSLTVPRIDLETARAFFSISYIVQLCNVALTCVT